MRLTAEQVAEVRASSESSGVLAPRFGVSASRIRAIRRGEASLVKQRERMQLWRDTNLEKAREANKRWRDANLEKAREGNREANKRWREADPENAEKQREAGLRWARENPEKAHANCVKRRALKRGATVGDPKAIAAVYRKAKSNQPISCAYCGKDTTPGDRHVDHVIALAHEDRGPHSADNLVIACARCNLRKGVKTPDEFRALLAAESKRSNV